MATGLVTEAGLLIPIVRSLVQRLTPVLRTRELQRRLAVIELDRGGSVLTAGRRLLGTGAAGAAGGRRVRRGRRRGDGRDTGGGRRAAHRGRRRRHRTAVGGRPAGLRLRAGRRPRPGAATGRPGDRRPGRAGSRRGGERRGHRAGPPRAAGQLRRAAALPARGPGARSRCRRCSAPGRWRMPARCWRPARRRRAEHGGRQGGDADGRRHAGLRGRLRSGRAVPAGPGRGAAGAGRPEHPAAGHPGRADRDRGHAGRRVRGGRDGAAAGDHRAARRAGGAGPAPAALRLAGPDPRPPERGTPAARGRPSVRLEPREELLAAALAIGLARRDNDTAALATACARARSALIEHPVDLYSLPYLGECAVAAARLGEPGWLEPHLDEAEALLDALGRPPLWAVTLHWYRMHAAVAAEDAAEVGRQAAVLGELAGTSAHHAVLAVAAESWAAVLRGEVDADVGAGRGPPAARGRPRLGGRLPGRAGRAAGHRAARRAGAAGLRPIAVRCRGGPRAGRRGRAGRRPRTRWTRRRAGSPARTDRRRRRAARPARAPRS